MHNREITHIVKTDSSSKTCIDCKAQVFILLSFERNLCKNTIQLYENTMQKLDWGL